jgi:hypothetical protein
MQLLFVVFLRVVYVKQFFYHAQAPKRWLFQRLHFYFY